LEETEKTVFLIREISTVWLRVSIRFGLRAGIVYNVFTGSDHIRPEAYLAYVAAPC
jgi:hypothetical protein